MCSISENFESVSHRQHNSLGMLPVCDINLKVKKPLQRVYPFSNDNSLGAYLKRKRFDLGWTRLRTSIHLEVSEDTYRNWEWNWFIPNIKYRKRIIDFLGFNFWESKNKLLGERLQIYRMEHSLTQQELAISIGIGKTTIGRLENCTEYVSIEIQEQIIQFLQVNTKELIENNG